MPVSGGCGQSSTSAPDVIEDYNVERPNFEELSDSDHDQPAEENLGDITKLTGRQKKLFELRLKMVGFRLINNY